MVFYFTCSDPRYTIYMGRDKYENEELIRYGWPEDLWFHVDKHSSAHVYLRLPREETIADVPAAIVHECAQLTKLNSIDGCKLNDVTIVYTMWGNLRKTGDMATGQIGFHKKGEVRSTVVHARVNDIVNRLNKTKVEKHNNPAELFELKQQRDAAELAESKAAASEARKGAALEKDAARQAASQARRESAERAAAAEEETEAAQALFANLAAGDVTFGGDDDAVYGASSDDDDGFGGGGGGEAGLDTALDDLFGGGPGSGAPGSGGGIGGGYGKGGAKKARSAAELKKAAAAAAAVVHDLPQAEVDRMRALTELAHKRKEEARIAAEAKAAAREEKAAKKAEKLDAEAAALDGKRADAAARAAAADAAARAAVGSGGADAAAAAAAADENAEAQAEERVVLQAIFGDDDFAELPGAADGAVRLRVAGETRAKKEAAVVFLARFPAEYPSHLPPSVELLEGVADAADAQFVRDSLALAFYEASVGAPVVHAWAEWLRDEWIAKLP
jgi:hypothetical protein